MQGSKRLVRYSGRGAVRMGRYRCLESAHDQATHKSRIAETNFALGRMDIDIDELRIAFDKQGERRMAIAGEEICVCAADRTEQKLVAHRPAIHEQELHLG